MVAAESAHRQLLAPHQVARCKGGALVVQHLESLRIILNTVAGGQVWRLACKEWAS